MANLVPDSDFAVNQHYTNWGGVGIVRFRNRRPYTICTGNGNCSSESAAGSLAVVICAKMI
jgi:hypothetical protein